MRCHEDPATGVQREKLGLLAWAALGLCVGACSTQAPGLVVDVEIVDSTGRNPLGTQYREIKLWAAQPGRPVEFVMADTSSGTFDLNMPIASDTVETRLRVELVGEDSVLIGAPPPFSPIAAGGRVRIVVGPQGVCEVMPDLQLEVARGTPATAQVDTFAVLAGGLGDGVPTSDVVFLDLLRLFSGRLDDLGAAVGAGRGSRLGEYAALFVHDEAVTRYELDVPTDRARSVPLHAGADASSTLARFGPSVVVIGGTDTSEASWVAASGDVRTTSMAAPRSHAAAFVVDGRVIVAGGRGDGPLAEVLDPASATSEPVSGPAGARVDPLLVEVPEGLWLLGGADETGTPRIDTVLLTGCPDSCIAQPGPDWPTARLGVTYVPELALLVGGQGSTWVERIVGGPTLELSSLLVSARRAPATFSYESGMLIVAGGEDDSGPRRDVEVCFPWALRPL